MDQIATAAVNGFCSGMEVSPHSCSHNGQAYVSNPWRAPTSQQELAGHTYSWQQPNDLGDLRPDIDELLEQKDGVQLT